MDDIQRSIGRLEAKVDVLLERSSRLESALESRDGRIAKLEHANTAQNAVVGVIATIAGACSAFISKFLGIT